MTDTELLEKKDLRDKMSDRIDVLNKVKGAFRLKDTDVMTVNMIAKFYIVPVETIQTVYKMNREEINKDGVKMVKSSDVFGLSFNNNPNIEAIPTKGGRKFIFDSLDQNDIPVKVEMVFNNVGTKCFAKRAVLRIGMLLRDSDVAKEVRTQLLNTFEHSTDEQKTEEIDTELDIIKQGIADASIGGTMMELSLAWKGYADYLNRHNIALQEKNDELATNNKALSGEILTWGTRESLNKAVRVIAGETHKNIGYVWHDLYNELLYHHHIGLSMRGKPPAIQYVHEDEWPQLIQSLTALCEKEYGLSMAVIMQKSKLSLSE